MMAVVVFDNQSLGINLYITKHFWVQDTPSLKRFWSSLTWLGSWSLYYITFLVAGYTNYEAVVLFSNKDHVRGAMQWEAWEVVMWPVLANERPWKKPYGERTDRQTDTQMDRQTDIRTLWLTRPKGPSQWKFDCWEEGKWHASMF